MAVKEVNALIRAKDSAGDSCLIYPITKKENVDGMDEIDAHLLEIDTRIADLSNIGSTNYDESIIALSVDGTTVTYVKGDGSVHTFETQDTNTEYSLATDETTGLTKLYATVGNAEDGTMTQKAIKTELDKKVGVAIDDSQNTLIFTI